MPSRLDPLAVARRRPRGICAIEPNVPGTALTEQRNEPKAGPNSCPSFRRRYGGRGVLPRVLRCRTGARAEDIGREFNNMDSRQTERPGAHLTAKRTQATRRHVEKTAV
jgi:hypothetical protein